MQAIQRAIDWAGGQQQLADMLGIRNYQTIQQWKRQGWVSAQYCPRSERLTGGAVRCEELLPTVDWTSLRGTEPVKSKA